MREKRTDGDEAKSSVAAEPATPLSHVPIGTKTGGFASPPYDGYALSIASAVSPESRASATCLRYRTSANGDLKGIQKRLDAQLISGA
jgi:hypothetical protein